MHVGLLHDHVGGASGGGGGVRQMLGLARGLLEEGCRVTIVCHDHDPASDLADIERDVTVLSVRRGDVTPPAGQRALWRRQHLGMRALARIVPADVDVVNAHEWPAVRAGRLAGRRLGVPFVWTRNDETMFERGLWPAESQIDPGSRASRIAHVVYNATDLVDARAAAAIVVLDNRNAARVRRAYRRDAHVVRSGPGERFFEELDRGAARASLGVPEGIRFVAAVGIMFRHRRFEDLIEAVAQLDAGPPVRARIVGHDGFEPGYADGLEALSRRLDVTDRVEVVRRSISDDELQRLYTAADVFVFPNERQTWGLAPLEALARGTPAIVSSGAGVHEVLAGRPGVWVVPPRRPDLIAAALAEAGGSREGVGPTREWIRTELSAERYAQGMTYVFRSVLGTRS